MPERNSEKTISELNPMRQKKNKVKSKKMIISLIIIGMIILILGSFYFLKNQSFKSKKTTEVIPVERLISNPSIFTGNIGVTGTIISTDISKSSFTLGCSDACVKMPVMYKGDMPAIGSEVIVYGKIKNDGGKYFFNASEVTSK